MAKLQHAKKVTSAHHFFSRTKNPFPPYVPAFMLSTGALAIARSPKKQLKRNETNERKGFQLPGFLQFGIAYEVCFIYSNIYFIPASQSAPKQSKQLRLIATHV